MSLSYFGYSSLGSCLDWWLALSSRNPANAPTGGCCPPTRNTLPPSTPPQTLDWHLSVRVRPSVDAMDPTEAELQAVNNHGSSLRLGRGPSRHKGQLGPSLR